MHARRRPPGRCEQGYSQVRGLLGAGLALIAASALPAGVLAQTGTSTGGAGFVATPKIAKVTCVARCASRERPRVGSTLRLVGSGMLGVTKIVFKGGKGRGDDVAARVRPQSDRSVKVRVPRKATSGPVVAVVGDSAVTSAATKPLPILPPPPPPPATGELTPVPGPRDPGGPQLETAISSNKAFAGSASGIVFAYRALAPSPVDIEVEVVRLDDGAVVKSWAVQEVEPGVVRKVSWNGTAGGKPQPEGRYAFRLAARTPQGATARSAQAPTSERDSFDLYQRIFPVRGRHDFGGAGARFGAGRSGHSHQGQDVLARCGVRLVAVEGGTVEFKQYQSAAGYYLVIHGDASGYDYAYMHLRAPTPFSPGDHVSTGEQIGNVGDTGDATACHLHLEMWTPPGWYDGGHPVDPLPFLKAWDQYS